MVDNALHQVHDIEYENTQLSEQLESFEDRLWEVEHWVDHQEERVWVDRASLVIDLTFDDEDEEIMVIPGFPEDVPQTLIPLEESENVAPGEVCRPSPIFLAHC